jgi:hypothetical protein
MSILRTKILRRLKWVVWNWFLRERGGSCCTGSSWRRWIREKNKRVFLKVDDYSLFKIILIYILSSENTHFNRQHSNFIGIYTFFVKNNSFLCEFYENNLDKDQCWSIFLGLELISTGSTLPESWSRKRRAQSSCRSSAVGGSSSGSGSIAGGVSWGTASAGVGGTSCAVWAWWTW